MLVIAIFKQTFDSSYCTLCFTIPLRAAQAASFIFEIVLD